MPQMSKDEGLQFRSFVPHLVDCLEDADGTVRETARNVIVELFRYGGPPKILPMPLMV